MRAVLDPNVLIAALISPLRAPARLLEAWGAGHFELIVSALLLDELERALGYPKLRRRITAEDAVAAVEWLRREATMLPDLSGEPPARSTDPDDDYLIALAAAGHALLVSGDAHLLTIDTPLAIASPAAFVARLHV